MKDEAMNRKPAGNMLDEVAKDCFKHLVNEATRFEKEGGGDLKANDFLGIVLRLMVNMQEVREITEKDR